MTHTSTKHDFSRSRSVIIATTSMSSWDTADWRISTVLCVVTPAATTIFMLRSKSELHDGSPVQTVAQISLHNHACTRFPINFTHAFLRSWQTTDGRSHTSSSSFSHSCTMIPINYSENLTTGLHRWNWTRIKGMFFITFVLVDDLWRRNLRNQWPWMYWRRFVLRRLNIIKQV